MSVYMYVYMSVCLSVCLCVCMSVCLYVELLYRSDFFPGLGWMLLRDVWLELRPNWPVAYVHWSTLT